MKAAFGHFARKKLAWRVRSDGALPADDLVYAAAARQCFAACYIEAVLFHSGLPCFVFNLLSVCFHSGCRNV